MQRISVVAIAVALGGMLAPFAAIVHADERLHFETSPVPPVTVAPGQHDMQLLAVTVRNTGDSLNSIEALTVTYTGASQDDIAACTVSLVQDQDGDLSTKNDRHTVVASQTFIDNKVIFSAIEVRLEPGDVTHLVALAALSTAVTDEHAVAACISGPDDIVTTGGGVEGLFPLESFNGGSHRIDVTASRIEVDSWSTVVFAGQCTEITVSCVDDFGNLDTGWSGSNLSVGGVPACEPGIGPGGELPSYTGGGVWRDDEDGRRACSYTLYKAETRRRIRIEDSTLGIVESGDISVRGSNAAGLQILPVDNQTAGLPFVVTVVPVDVHGNRVEGHAGSITTVASQGGIAPSPGGYVPVFPAPSRWEGTEAGGQKAFSVIVYNRCDAARLVVSDTKLTGAISNEFSVGCADVSVFAVGGPETLRLKTRYTFTVTACDPWGNTLSGYAATALVSCTDPRAVLPDSVALTGGTGSFSVVFMTKGNHLIGICDAGNRTVTGAFTAGVNAPPAVSRFALTVPERVPSGKPFAASLRACDEAGDTIREYERAAKLSVPPPASLIPGSIAFADGIWSGELTITGETLGTAVTVSDGEVVMQASPAVTVEVSDYQRARAYPTVFNPARENIRIRYFLREDREVVVTVFTTFMDAVREMRFPPGTNGGAGGLNVVEWNGRGDGGARSHSGAYHILIDKGYEKEWTAGAVKNF